jgi:hypothetical protein
VKSDGIEYGWGVASTKSGVYFATGGASSHTKIGYSENIDRRLAQMKPEPLTLFHWCPCDCKLQAVMVEAALHWIYAEEAQGNELFSIDHDAETVADMDCPHFILELYLWLQREEYTT